MSLETKDIKTHFKEFSAGILNSYSQVFFSDKKLFAGLLLIVTFIDSFAGICGLFSVLVTNAVSYWFGFDKHQINKGMYGFNSLLVGLGLGIYFSPGWLLFFILFIAALLTLFISVSLEGIIGKYALPYLSISFILSFWIVSLATREFTALGISERGIYSLNEMYVIGGKELVQLYQWWNSIYIPLSVKTYFISLGAIFFQFNVLSGILIAIGLLYYSRIAFSLSILGFYSAYLFYFLIGANITELSYSYIGFNFILTSIAIGGFFIIPSRLSYLWTIILMPMVVILVVSLNRLFINFGLPIYSLPFNVVVLLFLYILKFRVVAKDSLAEVFIQQNSPEKNFYSFRNYLSRFKHKTSISLQLPFYGEWQVTQAHNGEHTHKGLWQHAWDFMIQDEDQKTHDNDGDFLEDYYCYGKAVVAPADGYVDNLIDNVPDNIIGEVDIKNNWGNTIVIRHTDHLYTKLSHLVPESFTVKRGDKVVAGQVIGKCGNSGRSPYPHLHFQVQATPFIGSPTIDYPIGHYLLKEEAGKTLFSFSRPQLNDVISNISVTPLLQKAFHLIPGKMFSWQIDNGIEKAKARWEIKTNAYNQTYIECLETKSQAFFEEDGALLFFTHFKGNKSSLLYYFYLAAYKIQTGYYQDLELHDQYPLNHIFRKKILFLQDFFAPFFLFLRAEFTVKYSKIDNNLSPGLISLNSSSKRFIGKRLFKETKFKFQIDNSGIQSFKIYIGGTQINATCSN
ncbi:MAG: urea transporter [Bacteroidota bacterium]|nr:urea transporter [Bacteroidota bacterium]